MTWGRELGNVLASQNISKEFEERITTVEDRSKWRKQARTNPETCDAWWLLEISRANHLNYLMPMQKGHSAQYGFF